MEQEHFETNGTDETRWNTGTAGNLKQLEHSATAGKQEQLDHFGSTGILEQWEHSGTMEH